MKNDGFTLRKRLRSFRYAFHGIQFLIRHEHNAWIHCFAAVCVVTAGCLTGLSVMEWIAVIFAIGMVLAAEAVNSSIEALADLVSPDYNEAIKRSGCRSRTDSGYCGRHCRTAYLYSQILKLKQ